MRRVSVYDKDGFLMQCTVVVDCDNMRVGVFVSDTELVKATTDLALKGILYHVTVYTIPEGERPHKKAVQSGYLKAIQDAWLKDDDRRNYYAWLAHQKQVRLSAIEENNRYTRRLAEIKSQYTVDMRERYDNE